MITQTEYNVLLTFLFFDGTGYHNPDMENVSSFMMMDIDECQQRITDLIARGYIKPNPPIDKNENINNILSTHPFRVTPEAFDALGFIYLGKEGLKP